ncbi:glycosyl transferase [Bifidobacterium pseudolongum subsp. globosum]|uniref:Glycosyl transferase n=1 Tax=Bifidobacterium pseudolongum subsp. globosum TaxID=1690 RepID=A0A4Q5ADI0_9BIFI|nr:glycosyltransferase [Bifidobacterium pseudolongum]RYQ05017.1 glycosyl transferase [Bifidobacterium pseudolongum subsp. globosum]RYQ24122.1 glycosyl transferase [Bifidobacterium pseudolongum subsp. globosum]RYQ26838.1 glycosyl transferase [Bifidobacterium pseudolongum subsp. globosum]
MTTTHVPCISVIVPVFNQAPYVAACMDSIRAQTWEGFEVLVVDDGSTDESVRIMRDATGDDGRFTIIEQANQGVASARNTGLDAAHGTWICFVDPDDVVAPEYLETLYHETRAHPHADVIMSTCIAFDSAGERRQRFFPQQFTVTAEAGKKPLYRQLMDGAYAQDADFVTAIGVPWGKLYRRALLTEHHLHFDPALPRMQDNLFNMEVFHAARELVYVDYAGYHYRMGGLGARTLANTAKGLYHPAIDARARLMRDYRLDTDADLRQAWAAEQVNLYYQEIKAVAALEPKDWNAIRNACWQRACMLHPRLSAVDHRSLPKAGRLKYAMLTNRFMNTVAATLLWKNHGK